MPIILLNYSKCFISKRFLVLFLSLFILSIFSTYSISQDAFHDAEESNAISLIPDVAINTTSLITGESGPIICDSVTTVCYTTTQSPIRKSLRGSLQQLLDVGLTSFLMPLAIDVLAEYFPATSSPLDNISYSGVLSLLGFGQTINIHDGFDTGQGFTIALQADEENPQSVLYRSPASRELSLTRTFTTGIVARSSTRKLGLSDTFGQGHIQTLVGHLSGFTRGSPFISATERLDITGGYTLDYNRENLGVLSLFTAPSTDTKRYAYVITPPSSANTNWVNGYQFLTQLQENEPNTVAELSSVTNFAGAISASRANNEICILDRILCRQIYGRLTMQVTDSGAFSSEALLYKNPFYNPN